MEPASTSQPAPRQRAQSAGMRRGTPSPAQGSAGTHANADNNKGTRRPKSAAPGGARASASKQNSDRRKSAASARSHSTVGLVLDPNWEAQEAAARAEAHPRPASAASLDLTAQRAAAAVAAAVSPASSTAASPPPPQEHVRSQLRRSFFAGNGAAAAAALGRRPQSAAPRTGKQAGGRRKPSQRTVLKVPVPKSPTGTTQHGSPERRQRRRPHTATPTAGGARSPVLRSPQHSPLARGRPQAWHSVSYDTVPSTMSYGNDGREGPPQVATPGEVPANVHQPRGVKFGAMPNRKV